MKMTELPNPYRLGSFFIYLSFFDKILHLSTGLTLLYREFINSTISLLGKKVSDNYVESIFGV